MSACKDLSLDNAARIVYTSDSIGVSKGVVLEHKALCISIEAHGSRFGFDPHIRALHFAFDIAIQATFPTPATEGCICVLFEAQRLNELNSAICFMYISSVSLLSPVTSLIDPYNVSIVDSVMFADEASRTVVGL